MNFVNFISVNPEDLIVVWKGSFMSDGFVASPYYEVTSCFNGDLKLVKQYFKQLEINEVETAPL